MPTTKPRIVNHLVPDDGNRVVRFRTPCRKFGHRDRCAPDSRYRGGAFIGYKPLMEGMGQLAGQPAHRCRVLKTRDKPSICNCDEARSAAFKDLMRGSAFVRFRTADSVIGQPQSRDIGHEFCACPEMNGLCATDVWSAVCNRLVHERRSHPGNAISATT